MHFLKNMSAAVLVLLFAVACNEVDFKKTKGGMPYKLFPSKSGKKVENGKFIKAHIIHKVKDSVLFNSYQGLPVYFQVQPTGMSYHISEIFTELKEGDSVYAVQMMDTFIKKDPRILQETKFRNGDRVTQHVKILKVFDTAEEYQKDEEATKMAMVKNEETAVKEYLSKNNIQAERKGSGVYVQVLEPGKGKTVEQGKFVNVMYRGQTFEGQVFDTNMDTSFNHTEPMGFVVGVGQMIRGFDEGVQGLKEGGKARVFIPSLLAYGPQPPSNKIKPFEHLIFDVEVVEVLDKAPAQQPFQH
jgi:FKBP-type peptidyl-prolyl cis-trans isomerase